MAVLLILLVLIAHPLSSLPQGSTYAFSQSIPSTSPSLCTSFCLDNGDHCVFGTNQDNTLEIGLLFVNKRHVLKTTWDPSTSGEYARWVSRYGSVTINFVGYQMAWSGMNEAGLMISTMSVNETRGPSPDERPPFQGPFWMQYQLDNHNTVDQVIASNSEIRLVESAVDHYLVCDRTGACATIEFLEGQLVYHTDESLPVKALTNSTYEISVRALEEIRLGGGQGYGNSIRRFVTAANKLSELSSSSSVEAVNTAFDTLEAVSRDDTVWSFVHDPITPRVYFRTNKNPNIRYLDFSSLDFSCQSPVMMLDVHADVSGDISDDLVAYTHAENFMHARRFFTQYEGASMSPILVDTLLWGVESFPCQEGEIALHDDFLRYRPLVPPTISWAGLTVLHRVGPVWALLTGLSLAYLFWRIAAGKPTFMSKRLIFWVLVTILLGPFGLLAYLLTQRRKNRVAKAA